MHTNRSTNYPIPPSAGISARNPWPLRALDAERSRGRRVRYGRVGENGDIDRRNAEGVCVRLVSNEVDSRPNLSILLPSDLQSNLTIVPVLGFVNPRELASQSPATGELPLELIDEVEAGLLVSVNCFFRRRQFGILITYKAQPGPVGLSGPRSSWDRGHPCPRTVLVAPLSRACRGLEARAPRREARHFAKPRGRAEDRA